MKKFTPIVILIILISVGAVLYLNFQSNDKNPQTVSPENNTSEIEESGSLDSRTSSRYIEYSSDALTKAEDKKRVLFFYASWCPTCRPADESFRQNADKIPEDLIVIRVNYNDPETDQEEKDLARKYGVTYQHTYVQIDSDGMEVTKWNGGQIDELLTNLK